MVFAAILRCLMKEKQLTQAVLAEKTHISQSLISDYLSGNYKPRKDKLTLLAEALEVQESSIDLSQAPKNNEVILEALDFFRSRYIINYSVHYEPKIEEEFIIIQAFDYKFEASGEDFCDLYYFIQNEYPQNVRMMRSLINEYSILITRKKSESSINTPRDEYTSNNLLAQNLRDYRTAKGLASSKLADYLNVSKSLYGYWESGRSTPSDYYLAKLAEFYNCSVESLRGPINEEQKTLIKKLTDLTKADRITWSNINEDAPKNLPSHDKRNRSALISRFLQEFNTEANNEDPKKVIKVPAAGAYCASIGAPLYYFLFEKIVGLGYTSKELAIYDVSQYDPENGFYKEQPPVVITLSLVADLYNQVNTAYNNGISAYEKSKLQEALDALNKL